MLNVTSGVAERFWTVIGKVISDPFCSFYVGSSCHSHAKVAIINREHGMDLDRPESSGMNNSRLDFNSLKVVIGS